MKIRTILLTVFVSVASTVIALTAYNHYSQNDTYVTIDEPNPARLASYVPETATNTVTPVDFTMAAETTTPAVVHIKSTTVVRPSANQYYHPFQDLFGRNFGQPQPQERTSSGSGVIISNDGYIVTNNHVVNNSEQIEVVLYDNHSYQAELIGTDPSTDIAVIKIDVENLTPIMMSNSDSVRVGEWVLAVGNPFNLASTVTAGIVSAKARNINILRDNSAIESFIQTDAAVNPGNSGGALVNLRGELIGINTAIATPTGAYAGYSFAVPVNLVAKVVDDILAYGIVQRGYLGVNIRNIDNQLANDLDLTSLNGVYIDNVLQGSAAEEAGLKAGDVITKINGQNINSAPELQERVARYSPGDEIMVDYYSNGDKKSALVLLRNKNQGLELLSRENVQILEVLGAEFQELTAKEKKELGVESGVKVKDLKEGSIRKYTNMRPGFVITKVDRQPINNVDDMVKIMEKNKRNGVMVEGFYPGYPGTYYYAFGT